MPIDTKAQNWLLHYINPLVPNVPFLYPLKTSENFTVFWCFMGVKKEYIGKKMVKRS